MPRDDDARDEIASIPPASGRLDRAAFVMGIAGPTVHAHANDFNLHQDDRAAGRIQERAHTVLRLPGHPGTHLHAGFAMTAGGGTAPR